MSQALTLPSINVPTCEEAEQGLLGAILVNNKAYEKVGEFLRPEHFYDPAHQRIFAAIARMIDQGQAANPVTLKSYFDNDPDLVPDGGSSYLAQLAANVVTVVNAADYGRIIHDHFVRRQLIEIGCDLIENASRPDIDVPHTVVVEQAESQLFDLGDRGAGSRPVLSAADGLALVMEENERASRNRGAIIGVTTGLRDLDTKLGGLLPGLIVIGARPSMGKTGLAFNTMGLSAIRAGKRVLGFSSEMSTLKILRRMLAAMTGIPVDRQVRGDLSESEWCALVAAQAELGALPIHTDDTPGVTVQHIRRIARRHKRRHGLDLILIDHLHRMRASAQAERQGETAKITEITAGLCAVWKELEVPVVLLAQLNRDLERRDDKRPTMADLRQSGSIEQDADVIAFLYREQYYLERSEPARRPDESDDKFNDRIERWQHRMSEVRGLGEISIEKNRDGAIGIVRAHFDEPRILFSDLQRDTWGD